MKIYPALLVLFCSAACTAPERDHHGSEAFTPRPLTSVAVPRLLPGELPRLLAIAPHSATLEALRPTPAHLRELMRPRRLNAWSEPSNVKTLLRPISGATFDRTRGAALAEFLADQTPERAALGAAALSVFQTVQDDRLCEQPTIDLPVIQFEGENYEARYKSEKYLNFLEPVPALYALSSTCSAALSAAGGATATAIGRGCTLEDEAAHFEVGSPCRICLDTDGDLERCIGTNACRREMSRELGVNVAGELQYLDVIEAPTLACAPDYLNITLILAQELGPRSEVPDTFTHGPILFLAQWFWSTGTGQPELWFWESYRGVEPAIGDFTIGTVEYVRRLGETGRIYGNRQWLASEMEVEGLRFTGMALYPDTIGGLSKSRDLAEGGWSLNPRDLRPGNTDPNDIEQTFTRDWISAAGLKTATTITGVPIMVINRNLCAEDGWIGPDDKGRYYCERFAYSNENIPPDLNRWAYDFNVADTEGIDNSVIPFVTLAATGGPDTSRPYGHMNHILGSPTLADPDWDNCRYPDIFYPDERANWDGVWNDGDPTFTSQTYRFGKDAKFDVRMALATNWRRGFCAESAP